MSKQGAYEKLLSLQLSASKVSHCSSHVHDVDFMLVTGERPAVCGQEELDSLAARQAETGTVLTEQAEHVA